MNGYFARIHNNYSIVPVNSTSYRNCFACVTKVSRCFDRVGYLCGLSTIIDILRSTILYCYW